uniref:Calcium-activated potassium channel BK alpha subunit domain-containing protein n=1 Tax=Plectus sambesii TaxID=2011161 RepID=A0A914WNF0_9BILA
METSAKQLLCPGDGDEGPQMRKSDSFVKSLSRHSSFNSIVGEVPPLGRSIASFLTNMKRPYDPKRRAKYERHVVVTVTLLRAEVIIDFLNEFYAHARLQDFYVILLSPGELDNSMRLLLQVPLWAERIIYIRGSALKDADLERARLAEADSCFILSARTNPNKIAADEHTILRSWAVRDFAPHCPQYVQIFRAETKMHVKHAEYVICEDEFKFSLLANNCICPGISTFITLLMHTSRGEEGQTSSEPWHRLYGHHSGNEIYHILLGRSKFFGDFEGKSFTYASFHAHRKYGVCLVGVQKSTLGATIQLNPGQQHIMQKSDICYYMALTEEQMSMINTADPEQQPNPKVANTIASIGSLALEMQHTHAQPTNQPLSHYPKAKAQLKKKNGKSKKTKQSKESENMALAVELSSMTRRRSIETVPDSLEAAASQQNIFDSDGENTAGQCDICGLDRRCIAETLVSRLPRVTPYIGTSATLCHMYSAKRPVCCMQLSQPCSHCTWKTANEYNWANPAIIVAADHASSALYNFIIPLRAHYRPIHELYPIVLLLEQIPEDAFVDAISWFPLVYWMRGRIA